MTARTQTLSIPAKERGAVERVRDVLKAGRDRTLWAAQRYVFRPGWSRPILDKAERNLVAKGTPNAPRRGSRAPYGAVGVGAVVWSVAVCPRDTRRVPVGHGFAMNAS